MVKAAKTHGRAGCAKSVVVTVTLGFPVFKFNREFNSGMCFAQKGFFVDAEKLIKGLNGRDRRFANAHNANLFRLNKFNSNSRGEDSAKQCCGHPTCGSPACNHNILNSLRHWFSCIALPRCRDEENAKSRLFGECLGANRSLTDLIHCAFDSSGVSAKSKMNYKEK